MLHLKKEMNESPEEFDEIFNKEHKYINFLLMFLLKYNFNMIIIL